MQSYTLYYKLLLYTYQLHKFLFFAKKIQPRKLPRVNEVLNDVHVKMAIPEAPLTANTSTFRHTEEIEKCTILMLDLVESSPCAVKCFISVYF